MSHGPAGVVLTGGRSSRMGTDKAFVVVAGRPLTVAVADALWEAGCSPVECQGGDLGRLALLGIDAVPDTRPDRGPVGAISDALDRHAGPIVVAACDLPDLDAAAVRTVIAAGHNAGWVAVATAAGNPHLLSYWLPSAADALRRLLDQAPEQGVSYRDALAAVGAVPVEVPLTAVRNVNRPDDLDQSPPGRPSGR